MDMHLDPRFFNHFKAYPYLLDTPAQREQLPTGSLSLTTIKNYLRLDTTDTSEDTILNLMYNTAVQEGEKYTRLDFTLKTFSTYRDVVTSIIELRRAPFNTFNYITYQDDTGAVFTIDPSLYYITQTTEFAQLVFHNILVPFGVPFATSVFYNLQAVKLNFSAGYDSSVNKLPSGIIQALLIHIANMYENRGDNSKDGNGSDSSDSIPGPARALYNRFRILDISGGKLPDRIW